MKFLLNLLKKKLPNLSVQCEKIEGGLTLVEQRALSELALGAGACKVFIWVGCELTDDEVISHNYPLSDGTLFDNF